MTLQTMYDDPEVGSLHAQASHGRPLIPQWGSCEDPTIPFPNQINFRIRMFDFPVRRILRSHVGSISIWLENSKSRLGSCFAGQVTDSASPRPHCVPLDREGS